LIELTHRLFEAPAAIILEFSARRKNLIRL